LKDLGFQEKHAVAALHRNQMRLPIFYPTIDLLIFQTMFIIFNNVIFLEVFINQLGFKNFVVPMNFNVHERSRILSEREAQK